MTTRATPHEHRIIAMGLAEYGVRYENNSLVIDWSGDALWQPAFVGLGEVSRHYPDYPKYFDANVRAFGQKLQQIKPIVNISHWYFKPLTGRLYSHECFKVIRENISAATTLHISGMSRDALPNWVSRAKKVIFLNNGVETCIYEQSNDSESSDSDV